MGVLNKDEIFVVEEESSNYRKRFKTRTSIRDNLLEIIYQDYGDKVNRVVTVYGNYGLIENVASKEMDNIGEIDEDQVKEITKNYMLGEVNQDLRF